MQADLLNSYAQSPDEEYLRRVLAGTAPPPTPAPTTTPPPAPNTNSYLDSPYVLDAKQFEDAVLPKLSAVKTRIGDEEYKTTNEWHSPNGQNGSIGLTLANGKTWTPSGADSGIVDNGDGTYTVSGDLSALLGTPGSDKHVNVTYKKEGDKMVPVDAPKDWTWQHDSSLLRTAMLMGSAAGAGFFSEAGLGGAVGGAEAGSGGILETLGNIPTSIGTYLTPAGTPAYISSAVGGGALNAGTALARGADLGTALTSGVKGALISGGTGYLSAPTGLGIDKNLVNLGVSAATGNAAGVLTSGLNILGGSAPSGLIPKEAGAALNIGLGLKTGNYQQILSGAADLTGSKDVSTAAAATQLVNAARSGNLASISSAAKGLDSALVKAGATAGPATMPYNVGTGNNNDTNPYLNGSQEFYGLEDPNAGADALGLPADTQWLDPLRGDRGGNDPVEDPLGMVTITAPRERAPYIDPLGGDRGGSAVTPAAPTPGVPIPRLPTTPATTPTTPAAAQQLMQNTTTSNPVDLADISLMDLDHWTLEDLVKYMQATKAEKKQTPNPVYAAQGGSIDDLVEYLRR